MLSEDVKRTILELARVHYRAHSSQKAGREIESRKTLISKKFG